MVCLTGSSKSYSRFRSLWPLTHPSPSESSTEKVITLFPNRKPHQKRIMFLHKPVKKRAAKWTASPLRSNSAQSSETYSILNVLMAHGGGLSSAGMKFSLSASQLLTSDPRLQGKTPATTAVTTSGSGEGWAALLAKVKQCE